MYDDGKALFLTSENVNRGTIGSYNDGVGININASRCNSIYGSSSVVQPSALTSRLYIKF